MVGDFMIIFFVVVKRAQNTSGSDTNLPAKPNLLLLYLFAAKMFDIYFKDLYGFTYGS